MVELEEVRKRLDNWLAHFIPRVCGKYHIKYQVIATPDSHITFRVTAKSSDDMTACDMTTLQMSDDMRQRLDEDMEWQGAMFAAVLDEVTDMLLNVMSELRSTEQNLDLYKKENRNDEYRETE